jgi:quercetin dioxygenase-like cupin family protein
MRLYTFGADVSRLIKDFGSVGLTLTPIMRATGETQVVVMWLAAGGAVGKHAATCGQLFLVTQGEGWVEGGEGARREIHAGQAAWWDDGEMHAAGSDMGMAALVIEGDALDTALLRPLT